MASHLHQAWILLAKVPLRGTSMTAPGLPALGRTHRWNPCSSSSQSFIPPPPIQWRLLAHCLPPTSAHVRHKPPRNVPQQTSTFPSKMLTLQQGEGTASMSVYSPLILLPPPWLAAAPSWEALRPSRLCLRRSLVLMYRLPMNFSTCQHIGDN